MDFNIEFSREFERGELHKKFLRNSATLQNVALAAALVLALASGGGDSPHLMPSAFAALLAAFTAGLLILAKNMRFGTPVFASVLAFVPAVLWFAADAFAFSQFPWRAQYSLALMLFPLIAFFVSQQRERDSGQQFALILSSLGACAAAEAVGFFYNLPSSATSGTAGQISVSEAVLGFFDSSGTLGVVCILVFFASAIFCLRPFAPLWQRLLSGYVAVLAAGVAYITHNGAVWLGMIAGSALATLLLARKKTHRAAVLILLAAATIFTVSEADFENGIFLREQNPSSQTAGAETLREKFSVEKLALPNVALSAFAEHPILGTGAGSFPEEFASRAHSAGLQVSPKTAGSLYLTVLAENGLVGFLLLFAPAAFLLARAIQVCRKMPWREHAQSVHDFAKRIAEERVVLAGTSSGLVGAAVLFALDYSGFSAGIFCGIAIFGGIAAREARPTKREIFEIAPTTEKPRKTAFAIAVALPAVLALATLPTIFAEEKFDAAHHSLKKYFSSTQTGFPAEEADNDDLEAIAHELVSAVNLRKNHADAWTSLASAATLACSCTPEKSDAFAQVIDTAAKNALEISPRLVNAHISRANARIMLGDPASAKKFLESAESLAPQNAPALLQIAEIYRLVPGEEETTRKLFRKLSALIKNSAHVRQVEALLLMTVSPEDATDGENPNKENSDENVPKFNPTQFEI